MREVPPVPRTASLTGAVEAVFADNGPLPRAVPGFEPREGQRQMALAVASAFEEGNDLLVEAGTGTGKTLAYLVPAILARQRVLISTGTKNLQEQIYYKDIPLLRQALHTPFRAAYMKGRANYLCLQRFEACRRHGAPAADRRYLAMLGRWARRTETGDRAELDDLPEDVAIWSEINATSETCLGADCPQHADCFVTRMRQRAAEADLVIVNHHLLCADAAVRQGAYGEVIPECTFAVLDEAHQLEDVATQYFGVTASNSRVGQLCSDAERALGGTKEDTGDLRKDLERLRDHARGFFVALQFLRQALDGRRTGQVAGGDERVRLGPQMLADVAEPATSLLAALENVQGSVAAMKAPAEDLQAVARRAGEIRTDLAFLLRVGDADYVYFLETRGRGVFLRAAPIDVSSILRGLLFDRMQATVLTSATLTIAGSFEYARSRLGLLGGNELCLPSEFDYARQAILYLPPRMPDPRLPGFPRAASREIIEILRRTSGRAFVLFTSYSVLREVQPFAESELDYPLLVQGTAPRSALLEQFRGTPNSVLFGTSSFWQGVDVVGEALSCVIVDKLPFASPGDPITAARIESIAARGGNAFSDYQLPLAILTLQQGLGRLIRHRLDRGVLAVLDPRLKTKAYGKQFLDALPPSPVTSDLAAIETFMRG